LVGVEDQSIDTHRDWSIHTVRVWYRETGPVHTVRIGPFIAVRDRYICSSGASVN
jgi:hypothetical protein